MLKRLCSTNACIVDETIQISIVATLYKTGSYLADFVKRALSSAIEAGFDSHNIEIVFVNDGSPDNCLEIALALYKNEPRLRVIDLSRNFGHHKAMMVACQHARGDMVFLIDSDLEESPEWLLDFVRVQKKHQADLVFGVQQARKGSFFECMAGGMFYKTFNMLSSYQVAKNSVTARLMTRRFVNALLEHREQSPFLFGLCSMTGFCQAPVIVDKKSTSPTSYTLTRKIQLALLSIVSFSSRPLLYISTLGLFMTVSSLCYVTYILFRKWLWNIAPEGWTTLIASIWLVGGIITLCLGIISLYLSVLFNESKERPYAIVRKIYEHTSKDSKQ